MRLLLLLPAAVLVGCAARGTGEFAVPAGRYDDAFVAARAVLRDSGFDIERVDARAGVITTLPKASAGWATPWDTEQSTPTQETSDLFNRQRREVRVAFEPAPAEGEPVTGVVTVTVSRVQSPGVRPNPRSIQLTTISRDPSLSDRGVWIGYAVAVSRDPELEARLARKVESALAAPK
ncbi:MAG: hypothetical protein DYG92_02270 [Leptolyngbya sp. PLA1]|nr:hypothetical protein [Leptolyngbya sp. PLA1]